MKYLCLVFPEEGRMDALPKSEHGSLVDECLAYDRTLQASGHFIAAQALQPAAREALTVRVRRGQVSVTDGPFAETKEQLGGFILIDARDLDDAIQVAAKIPMARFGSIEVRPIRELIGSRDLPDLNDSYQKEKS